MKHLYFLLFVMSLLKVYTHSIAVNLENRTEVIDEFIKADLVDLNKLSDRITIHLNRYLSSNNWGGFQKIEQSDIDEFLDCFNLDSTATSSELLACYNDSKLRSLIDASAFQFELIDELTAEHNNQVLNYLAMSAIYRQLNSLRLQDKYSRIRPYLLDYSEEKDSMIAGIAFGYQGPVNHGIIEIDGHQIKVDSLPYNIGEVKGDIKFSYIGQNDKRIWRRSSIY